MLPLALFAPPKRPMLSSEYPAVEVEPRKIMFTPSREALTRRLPAPSYSKSRYTGQPEL